MEFGSLKYLGQVRQVPAKNNTSQQGVSNSSMQKDITNQTNSEVEFVKCGYGKLIWPDGSTFEGYWINGQACGVGVFRANNTELFEGFWQQDRTTGLCVFRQGTSEDNGKDVGGVTYMGMVQQDRQNGKGIEVWSDGSYYHGNF